ncbi:MAG: hypothetical protein Q8842_02940 [Candidatus Phytoplasma australasiaticum]|nr:hypothetical protein [Candidatus Phytoplasma australasiaticum]
MISNCDIFIIIRDSCTITKTSEVKTKILKKQHTLTKEINLNLKKIKPKFKEQYHFI